MEQILKTLEDFGVSAEAIEAIRATENKEIALIMLMDDDRHEYVD